MTRVKFIRFLHGYEIWHVYSNHIWKRTIKVIKGGQQ